MIKKVPTEEEALKDSIILPEEEAYLETEIEQTKATLNTLEKSEKYNKWILTALEERLERLRTPN